MATITLGGKTCQTSGDLPEIGTVAADFQLIGPDLSTIRLSDFMGERIILNIFPSIDTDICATSVRRFNEDAGALENLKIVTVSKDLPFALKRFKAGEGLSNVVMTSAYRSPEFGQNYGVTILDGAFASLFARAVVALNEDHTVVYTELVPEIGDEPDYDAALEAIG